MVITRGGERRRKEAAARLRRERKLAAMAKPRLTAAEQGEEREKRAEARRRRREEGEKAAGAAVATAEHGGGGGGEGGGGVVVPRLMMARSDEKEGGERETLTLGSLGFRLKRVSLERKTLSGQNPNLNQEEVEELRGDIKILRDIRDGKINLSGCESDMESLERCLKEMEDKEEEIISRCREAAVRTLDPKPEPLEEPETPTRPIYRRYPPTPWDRPIRREPVTRRIHRPPCVRDWPIGLQPFMQQRQR